jgi:hypothetical protein
VEEPVQSRVLVRTRVLELVHSRPVEHSLVEARNLAAEVGTSWHIRLAEEGSLVVAVRSPWAVALGRRSLAGIPCRDP